MKRLWISAFLLVMLITICTLGANTTQTVCKKMVQTIASAKKSATEGDINTAVKLSQKAVDDWNSYHKVLCTYMPHEQLEAISHTLSGMPVLCYYGANDQFLAECNKSIIQISYLKESQLLSLENIL